MCIEITSSVSVYLLMHTGCFNILAITNNAAMNIEMHVYLVELVCLFYLGKYKEVKLLDPTAVLFLVF